jgi:glycosyltransferase involved in cell wall biosynthesis
VTRGRHRPRLLINAAAVRIGGGGTFAVSQISALARRDEFDLTVIATGDVAAALEAVGGIRVCRPPTRSLLGRLLWEHVTLAFRSRHFDVLYCVGNFALPVAPVPQVVAMQNALHFGATARRVRSRYPRRTRLRLRLESALARVSVRRARAVISVSQSLRAAIEEDVGTRHRVRVIASATPRLPAARPPEQSASPYVVSVANDHPHKDWDSLVALFAAHPELPPLVAVGGFSAARRHRLETLAAGRVRFLGPIDDRAELADLYRAATCCIAHSWVESFGLTPLEALTCGIPVVVSDIPAHREVCRDSVTYYDPGDMQALGRSVRNAVSAPPPPTLSEPWTWDDNARELATILVATARSGRFDDRS